MGNGSQARPDRPGAPAAVLGGDTAGWQLAQRGELYDDISASLLRALSGLLIAVALIVPFGLAVDWYARLGELLNHFIEICRNTARLALLPVLILLLGIGETSKITMVIYSCTWPLLFNTIAAVKQLDPLLIKSARTMGPTQQQLSRKVILPAALPTIFVGIRPASASAILVLVASYERPTSFCVGSREFDPVNVGLVTKAQASDACAAGLTDFNVSLLWNSN